MAAKKGLGKTSGPAPQAGPPRGSGSVKRSASPKLATNKFAINKLATKKSRPQGIPDAVANRMARRIALASGIPSVLGMSVFIASYLLVSRQILDIPTGITLVASGGCFLLGVVGLSYGVLSSSWEAAPGTLLGGEQIGLNIGRLRASLRGNRSGDQQG